MQSVHVGNNILFILFIFYSRLLPNTVRFKPISRLCHKARSPCVASASLKQCPVIASPPLPLFPFPLTTPPPLLSHTTSLPCSTSMSLAKHRRDRIPHPCLSSGTRYYHLPITTLLLFWHPVGGGGGEVYEVEVLIIEDKAASFGAIQTAVWMPDPLHPTEVDPYHPAGT
jgi:hypothetical protein